MYRLAQRIVIIWPFNLIYNRLKSLLVLVLRQVFPKRNVFSGDVVVENSVNYSICPFCKNDRVHRCGQINYPVFTRFADESITLTRHPELWACSNCSSGFTQNAIPEKDAVKFYSDNKSVRWSLDEAFTDRRPGQVVDIIQKIIEPGMSILDIGCSNGIFLDFAAALGGKTYGIDPSRDAISIAASKGHTCYEVVTDFETQRRFDAIFSFDVVEHIYDVPGFFEQYAAYLKAGGLFIILTGDIQSASAVKHGSSWWYARYPDHIMFPTIDYFSTLPGFDLLDAHKTYAMKWQDGTPGWKRKNIILRRMLLDYHGMPSFDPDHILVILRKDNPAI